MISRNYQPATPRGWERGLGVGWRKVLAVRQGTLLPGCLFASGKRSVLTGPLRKKNPDSSLCVQLCLDWSLPFN